MTLIATFSVNKYPVVFGDLLLTGPASAGKRVALPTQGPDHDFFGDSGWAISGLTQKVNIVSPNCAIAWAGSWLEARCAISGLRDLAQSQTLTTDVVRSFLRAQYVNGECK